MYVQRNRPMPMRGAPQLGMFDFGSLIGTLVQGYSAVVQAKSAADIAKSQIQAQQAQSQASQAVQMPVASGINVNTILLVAGAVGLVLLLTRKGR